MTSKLKLKPITRSAIRARYTGPTNYRGTRVIVSDGGMLSSGKPRRTTHDWNYELNHSENYAVAAQKWLDQHNPGATIRGPGLVFDHDYYFTWKTAP